MQRLTIPFSLFLLFAALGCDSGEPGPTQPPPPSNNDQVYVSGRVQSTHVYPVDSVVVTLRNEEGEYSDTTDSNGEYRIAAVEGMYELEVLKDGYVPLTEEIDALQTTERNIDIAGAASITGFLRDPRQWDYSTNYLRYAPMAFTIDGHTVNRTTDQYGGFSLDEIPPGSWYVAINGPAPFLGETTIEVIEGENDLGLVNVVPLAPPTGYRIKLSWNEDISHNDGSIGLTVTRRFYETDKFFDWFCQPFFEECLAQAGDVASGFRTGYGHGYHERNIVLFRMRSPGFYRITVSRRADVTMPDFFWESGATVELYQGNVLARTYTAQPGSGPEGTNAWRVAEIHVSGSSVEIDDNDGQTLGYMQINYFGFLQERPEISAD